MIILCPEDCAYRECVCPSVSSFSICGLWMNPVTVDQDWTHLMLQLSVETYSSFFSLLDYLSLWGENGRLRGSNILTDLSNPLYSYFTCSVCVSLWNWIGVIFLNFLIQKCILLFFFVFFYIAQNCMRWDKNTYTVFSFSLSVSQMFRFSGFSLQKFLFLDGNRELEIRGKLTVHVIDVLFWGYYNCDVITVICCCCFMLYVCVTMFFNSNIIDNHFLSAF